MNNPNPFIPQGSLWEQQKNKARARLRLAVYCTLSLSSLGLVALLIQGCRKPSEPETAAPDTNNTPAFVATNTIPETDTNLATTNAAPPVVAPDTNVAPPAVATPAAQEYVVAKGDSFYTIAKKFNVTIKALEEANPNVQPTKLQIGQKLKIPAPAAGAAPATAPAATENATGGEQMYTVKSGDTLTKIAGEFGVTVRALRSANNLSTDKIRVGQKLKIPAKAAPAPAPTNPAPAAAGPTA